MRATPEHSRARATILALLFLGSVLVAVLDVVPTASASALPLVYGVRFDLVVTPGGAATWRVPLSTFPPVGWNDELDSTLRVFDHNESFPYGAVSGAVAFNFRVGHNYRDFYVNATLQSGVSKSFWAYWCTDPVNGTPCDVPDVRTPDIVSTLSSFEASSADFGPLTVERGNSGIITNTAGSTTTGVFLANGSRSIYWCAGFGCAFSGTGYEERGGLFAQPGQTLEWAADDRGISPGAGNVTYRFFSEDGATLHYALELVNDSPRTWRLQDAGGYHYGPTLNQAQTYTGISVHLANDGTARFALWGFSGTQPVSDVLWEYNATPMSALVSDPLPMDWSVSAHNRTKGGMDLLQTRPYVVTDPTATWASAYNFSIVPPQPTGFTVTNTTTGIELSWDASSDTQTTNYQVWRDGSRLVNVSPRATTSWSDTNVTPGTDHAYSISAFIQTSESTLTDEQVGHIVASPTSSIVGFVVTNQSGAIRLDWAPTSDPNATGYRIYRNGTTADEVVPAAQTTWSDTNVTPDVSYNYSVSAESRDGFGPATANQSGMLYVEPPHHLLVLNTTTSVNLSWDLSLDSNVTSYDVLRNDTIVASTTSSTWREAAANITPAVSYNYSVAARVDAQLASAPTANAPGHVISPPAPPTDLAAMAQADGVLLTWTRSVDASVAGYNVYRGTSSDFALATTNIVTTAAAADSTVLDTSATTPGSTYYYRLTAFNSLFDESAPSNMANATIPASLSGGGATAPTTLRGGQQQQAAPQASASFGGLFPHQLVPPRLPLQFYWWQWLIILAGLLLVVSTFKMSRRTVARRFPQVRVPPIRVLVLVLGAALVLFGIYAG